MTGERAIKSVAIIGSQGQMGRLFMNLCIEHGLSVRGLDKPMDNMALAMAIQSSELVLLAVPIHALADVLLQVKPHLSHRNILADLCSVKVGPVEHMLAAWDGPVVGTHPLFGPRPLEGERVVAITPGRDDAALDAVEDWLKRIEFSTFRTTAHEHDRAMAFIQGLNFVTNTAYLSATAGQPDIERFITPSFRRRLESARKMLTEDAGLFEALFEANPYAQEAVRLFRSHLNVAAGGDVSLLAERAQWWWRDDKQRGGA
ncbi:prephenate dehydrogenase/arogenate dehydrogenase family protein [Desulfocurvibacter africanus]|uniref:prephenate dehydrogenase/arogenate dehydrogenase family protein n=1 Tax=Desulfocurvibacter africanus TaxID=873 RepID=UPI002FDB63A3